MGLKQTPPGGGGGKAHVHFTHVKTAHGQQWHAHMAGPIHWFTCHASQRSKPCLHAVTDGELVCDRCGPGRVTSVLGYVPMYREVDGKPVFVVVYDHAREQLDQLKFHRRVLVGRGPDQNDTIYILEALKQATKYDSRLPERWKNADLTPTLLKIWGIPELAVWYMRTEGKSDNAMSLPTGVAKKSDGTPFSPGMQAAAKRWAPDTIEPGSIGEAIDLEREQLMRKQAGHVPHSNGKAPKKS